MAKIKYRLGIDLGANSLGWCVYRLNEADEPCSIVRMGARIFPDGRDPKSLASRAADRRAARQARRRRDRLLKRRQRMIDGLVRFGLMPESPEGRLALKALDPYELRARALDGPVGPFELGRALYHLCRKRGFRSSRKDRNGDEKDLGKVKSAIAELRSRIDAAGCRTVGEYLAREHREHRPVRGRRRSDGQYALYLQREMVADEFDALWAAQRRYNSELLTDEAREYLRDTLLFQRRLLPVAPGRCLFEENEPRARLCSPLQQKFRLLQELNNLRLVDGPSAVPLTLEQRNHLYEVLRRAPRKTFAEMRKLLGVPARSGIRFNLESENRRDLKGDLVSAQLSRPECLGEHWFSLDSDRQESLAALVVETDDAEALVTTLVAAPYVLTASAAAAVARCSLPDDFGSLSLKALHAIVPELERDVVTYDVAVRHAGYQHHSQLHTGEYFLKSLPYYGEILRGYTAPTPRATDRSERDFGRIPNPTVHIGLNQLRLLINALIRRYGNPQEIVIELTREFGLGGERRRELLATQAENEERNRRYDERLRELGVRPSRENRQKLQLWEELGQNDALDRCCVYSGTRLSLSMLFSDAIEVDHVLPFSRSLHDGIGNKVLCTRQANRDKGNRTPFEAFGHSPAGYDWEAVVERASKLSRRKPTLFSPTALEDFLDDKDFLDRHLTDTAYLSRAARQYLSYVCHKDRVWVSSGRLTAMVRGKYALNELLSPDRRKNRNDHRHHALDAAVIGLCSRSLIQQVARAAARAEERGESRLLEALDLPWIGYRDELRDCLGKIIVSHKPDHGKAAALHNDTNYGRRGAPDARGATLVGHRVPLESLTASDIDRIAGAELRERLRVVIGGASGGKQTREALTRFGAETGVRRVLLEERLSVIPIHDRRTGEPYRYVKGDGNYCYEIFEDESGRWDGDVISNFEANQPGFSESLRFARNGRPLVMRLRRNDQLMVSVDNRHRIMRVAFFTQGKIALAEHHEANVDSRSRDKTSGFKYLIKSPGTLKAVGARVVGVDVLGYANPLDVRTRQ